MPIEKIELTWKKWLINNIFNANNTIISLLTTLFFITALVLFFWYVIADQLKIIVLDKVEIIKLYSKHNPEFKKIIQEKIKNKKLDEYKLKTVEKERNDKNIKTFSKMLMWWFVVLIFLVILNVIYLKYKKEFTKADVILLFFVLTAFVAEVIFYIVIIREWKIIGDNEIIR